MSAERWKPVVGFEGSYEVSDLGRVRSLDRVVWCEGPTKGRYASRKPGRVLRPGPMTSGHLTVALGRGIGSKTVHSLVMAAFVGPYPVGTEIRHLDGNPANNVLANLQYATRSVNGIDKKYHNGCRSYRLTPEDVRRLKAALNSGATGVSLARKFGVAQSTVSSIKTGRFHRDIAAY